MRIPLGGRPVGLDSSGMDPASRPTCIKLTGRTVGSIERDRGGTSPATCFELLDQSGCRIATLLTDVADGGGAVTAGQNRTRGAHSMLVRPRSPSSRSVTRVPAIPPMTNPNTPSKSAIIFGPVSIPADPRNTTPTTPTPKTNSTSET